MYISRKELSINIDTKIYEYFFCMKQSNDLKSYCKKYNFDIRNIDKYLDIFPNIYSYLDEINDEFIKKELINKKDYLDNILVECDSNINLDEEQRVAILTDEDYDLIIAGAGAGKTTTVAGKVKYLVDQKNIDPKKILIVSFTNKEVNELRERINKQLHIDSPISTFHSIGRAITLKDETQIKQGIIDNCFWIVNQYLSKIVINNEELLKKVILLFGYYLDIPEDMMKGLSLEEYFDIKERKDFSTIKSDVEEYNKVIIDAKIKEKRTTNNEVLRSCQEVQIANFLYLNYKDKSKQERTFYKDKFISKKLFQWESENNTTVNNETGKKLLSCKTVYLFIRKMDEEDGITLPFTYFGTGRFDNVRESFVEVVEKDGTTDKKKTLLFDIILDKEVDDSYCFEFEVPEVK